MEVFRNLNPATMFDSLRGKVAFITGGDSGLGRAIADQFAAVGIRLVIASINKEGLKKATEEIRANGGECEYQFINVRSAEQIQNAIDFTIEKYGKLNYIINNAGTGIGSHAIHEITPEQIDMVIEVLLNSIGYSMSYGIKRILETKSNKEFCSIINVSSATGLRSSSGLSQYSAAKRGVIGMTTAAANEYARHNITVNAICPGTYKTAIYNNTPEKMLNLYAESMPQGQMGDPVEMGHLALFLVSDMARAINGVAIPLDGGLTGADCMPVKWEHPEILD